MFDTAESARQARWETRDGRLVFVVTMDDSQELISTWAPQPGSQSFFLDCPTFELLYTGTRGPGKTEALLMDFAQEVGKGFGKDWRGVLFRRTYPELEDVISKSQKLYPLIFPGCRYHAATTTWKFADGEELLLRNFSKPDDYWSYHGHAYPWVGWEELTNWPTPECYLSMMSTIRSTNPAVPSRLRATTNPYGKGHNWVKRRWRLPVPEGGSPRFGPIIQDFDDRGRPLPARRAVHGDIAENRILLAADPDYISRIMASTSNPAMVAAWLEGSWDITSGGMFDDLWNAKFHVIPPFDPRLIPKEWRIDRAYDHGSSAPFSVGWYAESNGEPFRHPATGKLIGGVPGDIIRFAEWYGWNGRDNEGLKLDGHSIGKGIKEREVEMGIHSRVRPGPADSSIFDPYNEKSSVAADFQRAGIKWDPADKGPGSRKQGWEKIRAMLKDATAVPRERPGLFVTQACEHFLRTVPVLSRSSKDPDDVDSALEDHIGDELRYRLRRKANGITMVAV